jgi:hypothetical protein
MLQEILNALNSHVSEETLRENVTTIFESDRWSTFKHYNATAKWLQDRLQSYGVDEVELEPVPADGVSVFGDWVMPLAWDAESGTLDLLDENGNTAERLADYKACPDHLIIGSEPTPAGGMVARLIPIDDSPDAFAELHGNMAFTSQIASSVRRQVAEAGGIGVVSCYHPVPEEDPESLFWNNRWSDRPGGWWRTSEVRLLPRMLQKKGCQRAPHVCDHIRINHDLVIGSKVRLE